MTLETGGVIQWKWASPL